MYMKYNLNTENIQIDVDLHFGQNKLDFINT